MSLWVDIIKYVVFILIIVIGGWKVFQFITQGRMGVGSKKRSLEDFMEEDEQNVRW